MSELRLANPLGLLMAAPLVAAALISIYSGRRIAVAYSSARLVESLPVTFAQRVRSVLPWLRFMGLGLLVVALARPQHGLQDFRIRAEGIAIMMCVDRSGSMQALDFFIDGQRVDRLQAVKHAFRDFVAGNKELRGRHDDQIGLISFGGFAAARSPLTLDHTTLLEILNRVQIARELLDPAGRIINQRSLEEERSTAIGDAVALAVDRLKDCEAKSRVIILLSDGESNAGVISPEEAAAAAQSFGIKVYTIGVGTTGRAPFRVVDGAGRERLVEQLVRLDERTLKMLAEKTGGHYFNAQNSHALENVYAEIDQLEKTTLEGRLYTEYRDLYHWLLLPGLGLVVLEWTLRCTRFRTLP